MRVTFLQSADTVAYREMVDVTSKTFMAYCGRHALEYQLHLGIIRGSQPWHAALNRIPLLRAFAERGYLGWVVYADADAYVADLGFDVRAYLEDKQDMFMAAAPSGVPGAPWWDVNNGVFALNFAHPLTRVVLAHWQARLDRVSDADLEGETAWGVVIDDQHALHLALQDTPEAERALFLDGGVLNWSSRFIRQLVRIAGERTRASRVAALRGLVAGVLQEHAPEPDEPADEQGKTTVREEFVNAVYRVFFGREADGEGRAHVLRLLSGGERSMEQELRAALASDEARAYLPTLLASLLSPDELRRLAQAAP